MTETLGAARMQGCDKMGTLADRRSAAAEPHPTSKQCGSSSSPQSGAALCGECWIPGSGKMFWWDSGGGLECCCICRARVMPSHRRGIAELRLDTADRFVLRPNRDSDCEPRKWQPGKSIFAATKVL